MLILLDIDGVMDTTPPWRASEQLSDGFQKFNTNSASNLQRVIAATGARIVLTTSHRGRFSVQEWTNIFRARGINAIFSGSMGKFGEGLNRRGQIEAWIEAETPTAFVIIDDDKSLHDLRPEYKSRCVITNPLIGLDEESASMAIRILNSQIQHEKGIDM